MAKIKIRDISRDQKVSKEEMKRVFGGVEPTTFPKLPLLTTGDLSQQLAGTDWKLEGPIKHYPGPHWSTKS